MSVVLVLPLVAVLVLIVRSGRPLQLRDRHRGPRLSVGTSGVEAPEKEKMAEVFLNKFY